MYNHVVYLQYEKMKKCFWPPVSSIRVPPGCKLGYRPSMFVLSAEWTDTNPIIHASEKRSTTFCSNLSPQISFCIDNKIERLLTTLQ